MVSHRVLSSFLFAWVFAGGLRAQSTASQRESASPPPSPSLGLRTIAMIVPEGTPIQIALDKEVRIRAVGQPISGRVMEPVYVFDHLVIPIGTAASGRISAIYPVPGRARMLDALNANFTPAHKLAVVFDELVLPDGRHFPLHANVVPGSGQVVRLVTADQHKKNVVKDAAATKMDQARAQWNNAMKQVESPGRMHLVTRYAVAQLPAHPQYIDAGTLYSAELSQPLFNQGSLILPAGTRLRGSVLQVRPARSFHRNGQLRIAFREVVLPDGAVQTVDTSLQGIQSDAADNAQLDAEGGAKATSSKMRYISTGTSVGLALIGSGGRNDVGDAGPTAGGATGFKLIGLIVGIAFRSHTYGILMSAYGGSRSIYNNFLGRGRNIVFPKNTAMEIGFGNRTSLPMPGAEPGKQR